MTTQNLEPENKKTQRIGVWSAEPLVGMTKHELTASGTLRFRLTRVFLFCGAAKDINLVFEQLHTIFFLRFRQTRDLK